MVSPHIQLHGSVMSGTARTFREPLVVNQELSVSGLRPLDKIY